MSFRIFVVGAEILCVEAPPGVEEAYDIMVADHVPPQRAADLAVAAAQRGDPVAFARHFVRVRKEFRERNES